MLRRTIDNNLYDTNCNASASWFLSSEKQSFKVCEFARSVYRLSDSRQIEGRNLRWEAQTLSSKLPIIGTSRSSARRCFINHASNQQTGTRLNWFIAENPVSGNSFSRCVIYTCESAISPIFIPVTPEFSFIFQIKCGFIYLFIAIYRD